MSRRAYRPDFDPVTTVPVIPVHKDMEGRDAPDQHPISAITGLEDELDAKVDAEVGKGLSTEDYTTEEKAKLSLIEDDAEANTIVTIKVNGSAVQPDEERAVDLDIPAVGEYADAILYNQATGEIRLMASDGSELSRIQTPLRSIITSAEWDEANTRLILTKADGTRFLVPMQITLVPVVGDGVDTQTTATENGVVVSLTAGTKAKVENTVNLTGTQTVAGTKTFTSNPRVSNDRPIIWMVSDMGASDVNVQYGEFVVSGNSTWSDIYGGLDVYSQNDGVFTRLTAWNHLRDHAAEMAVKSYDDGTGRGTAPTYSPVDGQGAPAVVPSGTVITEGRLAVDPQVVHTYGTESIAGSKTLTSPLHLAGSLPTLIFNSTKRLSDTGGTTVIRHYITDGQGDPLQIAYDDVYLQSSFLIRRLHLVGRDSSEYSLSLFASDDGYGFGVAPTYLPVDGQGGRVPVSNANAIITQGMLASDPQTVHTYGAQSIAGVKTFTGTMDVAGSVRSKMVMTPATAQGESYWYKMYSIAPADTNNYTIVLWASPRSPALNQTAPSGMLMASVRASACQLKWMCGMTDAAEASLHQAALVYDATSETPEWSLWVHADGFSWLTQRMEEYTAYGPATSWAALAPTVDDAQESLPSGENITVYYAE